MHFVWELSFGQIIIGIPIVTLAVAVIKMYGLLLTFRIEHEVLMTDWAKRQEPLIDLDKLPWRQKRWF
jgi:hypothetical protein